MIRDEFIGEKITITKSPNKSLENTTGIVVDETKNTIKIRDKKGKTKTLMKSQITIKFEKTGKIVDGISIMKRSEDRIKK